MFGVGDRNTAQRVEQNGQPIMPIVNDQNRDKSGQHPRTDESGENKYGGIKGGEESQIDERVVPQKKPANVRFSWSDSWPSAFVKIESIRAA